MLNFLQKHCPINFYNLEEPLHHFHELTLSYQEEYLTINLHIKYINITKEKKKNTAKEFVESKSPDLLLISLGINDYRIALEDPENYRKNIKLLLDSVSSVSLVVWITPPKVVGPARSRVNGLKEVRKSIHSATKGRYVESQDITGPSGRKKNGIGFEKAGAQAWAEAIVTRLDRGSF